MMNRSNKYYWSMIRSATLPLWSPAAAAAEMEGGDERRNLWREEGIADSDRRFFSS